MRLLYFFILLFSLNSDAYSQKLFKSFVFQMPMEEARLILNKDSKILNDLSKLAKDAFTALGGKSLGRIDIKMNHLGEPHFIEANLMPGLQKGYFYRSCALNLDMNYDDMIYSITNTGLSSH